MKLTQTATYAIQAVLELAQADDSHPVPCSVLANQGKMPERFLLQVLRVLVLHGVLESKRGIAGGFLLSRPASQITLSDIVLPFEHPKSGNLPEAPGFPEPARYQLELTLQRSSEAARKVLQQLTIYDLMQVAKSA